jgi:methyl-accepting chemotaxis protein
VKRVTDIMAEITAASQEQSGGIEQVNQAVSQMDRVTQQNAALVEQAAAAAESMEGQATTLSKTVSIFRLAAAQPRTAPAPVPARRETLTPASASRAQPRHALAAPAAADEWEEF